MPTRNTRAFSSSAGAKRGRGPRERRRRRRGSPASRASPAASGAATLHGREGGAWGPRPLGCGPGEVGTRPRARVVQAPNPNFWRLARSLSLERGTKVMVVRVVRLERLEVWGTQPREAQPSPGPLQVLLLHLALPQWGALSVTGP